MGKVAAKPANSPVQPIKTLQELADLVRRDVSNVSRWMRRDDWPFGKLPIARGKVPDVVRWSAEHLRAGAPIKEPSSGTPDDPDSTTALRKRKLEQEIRKLFANADQAETALARERGQLLEATAVEREWAGIGVVVRNGMTNLADQLQALAMSHGMPSEASATFRQQADEAIAGVLRHLSSEGSENRSRSA